MICFYNFLSTSLPCEPLFYLVIFSVPYDRKQFQDLHEPEVKFFHSGEPEPVFQTLNVELNLNFKELYHAK